MEWIGSYRRCAVSEQSNRGPVGKDSRKPKFAGRHTVFHGFGRSANETHPHTEPTTWWGSATVHLPEDTAQSNVRLQAEDGAHSSGILYRRGGEKTVVVFN